MSNGEQGFGETALSLPPQGLPASAAGDRRRWVSDGVGVAGVRERGRILLAEDDADLLAVMGAILETDGFHVHSCRDGRDACVEFSVRRKVDLVVCDVGTRYFSGVEVGLAVAALDPEVPIILLSGAGLSEEDEKIIAARGWHLLMKPFTTEHLLKTIKNHLRRHSAGLIFPAGRLGYDLV